MSITGDGDGDIVVYHNHGAEEKQDIYYDVTTGEVVWKYRRAPGPSTKTPRTVSSA